eukprot:7930583-Pyramimonas_sp.AAC.1
MCISTTFFFPWRAQGSAAPLFHTPTPEPLPNSSRTNATFSPQGIPFRKATPNILLPVRDGVFLGASSDNYMGRGPPISSATSTKSSIVPLCK